MEDTKEKNQVGGEKELGEEKDILPKDNSIDGDKNDGNDKKDQEFEQAKINTQLIEAIEKLTEKVEKIGKSDKYSEKIKSLSNKLEELDNKLPKILTPNKPKGYYNYNEHTKRFLNEEVNMELETCKKIWDMCGI